MTPKTGKRGSKRALKSIKQPTVIHTLWKSHIQSAKITFIQRFRGVNALGSGESDLALQLGIMPSSNGKYTN